MIHSWTQLEKALNKVPVEEEFYHLFLSTSNGEERAFIQNERKENLNECLGWLESQLKNLRQEKPYIRVDLVTRVQEYSYKEFKHLLSLVPRNNYFRKGVALDKRFKVAFLAEELMGSALIRPSKEHVIGYNKPNLSFDEQNLNSYMKKKYGEIPKNKTSQRKFYVFETQGFYYQQGKWLKLSTEKSYEGIRQFNLQELPKQMACGIRQGEAFLRKQIKDSGQFIYGYYPTYDYEISGYNSVRHFSSVYALLEAQEYLGLEKELQQAEKALDWGLQHLTFEKEGSLYIKEETSDGISVKLGAQALALLALAKYQSVTGSSKYEEKINLLIQGIETSFIDEEGNTIHILDEKLETKQKFNIIYYDGEAVFGILRGYGITKNPQHLALAKRLFEGYVARHYEKYHDHWLSYAVNEILLYLDEPQYYEFGLKNAFENLTFMEERDTVYPTLLELLMAAIKMTDKLKASPYYQDHQLTDYVSKMDFWRLKQVALKRAQIEVEKGIMHPEMAMFLKKPDKTVHGFYTRHDKFRMRIDDQEHFLSGLIHFYDYFYLEEEESNDKNLEK